MQINKLRKDKKMFSNVQICLIIILSLICSIIAASSDKGIASLSHLNTIELENFKYQIDIDKSIHLSNDFDSTQNSDKSAIINIKSVYGQAYECHLPNDYLSSIDDSEEFELTSNKNDNNQINFTLVNAKIQKYSSNLINTNTCIIKVSFNFLKAISIEQLYTFNQLEFRMVVL